LIEGRQTHLNKPNREIHPSSRELTVKKEEKSHKKKKKGRFLSSSSSEDEVQGSVEVGVKVAFWRRREGAECIEMQILTPKKKAGGQKRTGPSRSVQSGQKPQRRGNRGKGYGGRLSLVLEKKSKSKDC